VKRTEVPTKSISAAIDSEETTMKTNRNQIQVLLVSVLMLLLSSTARSQTFTVLHTFAGFPNDGKLPYGTLIEDADGNLYGTTVDAGKYGGGTVYEIDSNGNESVLYNFIKDKRGAFPFAGLTLDSAGNLLGTAQFGGDGDCELGTNMCGVVFRLTKSGTETVVHRFQKPGTGGATPLGGVVIDSEGNIYGTTQWGGTAKFPGDGVVYKIDATGRETSLHSFNGADGSLLQSGLVRDSAGNLYGTTQSGGLSTGNCNSCGTVFKISPTGKRTVLHSFTGTDGMWPQLANLAMDAAGNLYGTTPNGGDFSCTMSSGGCGVVFKIDVAGNESVIYAFKGGADGWRPEAGLSIGTDGNLYGTAAYGGDLSCPLTAQGCGVVFKIDPSGHETVLYTFTGGNDGAHPEGVILDAKGNLYGTAVLAGAFPSICGSPGNLNTGCGIVFKITP
jgi:uncharacterized repeat protein (TIGR03803 family)